MFGKSNVTRNPVTKPDVTMKARYIIRSACNDKVFDISENVLDKTVTWKKIVFCTTMYMYMYLEERSPPLPKIRVMALPPYVSTSRKI